MSVLPPAAVLACALLASAPPALAQPHIWTVPGTAGATYYAILWDSRTRTMTSLLAQRNEPWAKSAERPLRSLANQAPFDLADGSRPRLPEHLRRQIGSFLVEPMLPQFRAALALEAIRSRSARTPVNPAAASAPPPGPGAS